MKKTLSLLLISVCLLPANAMADNSVTTDSLSMEMDTLGIHPYKKRPTTVTDFARWSLTFEVGMSLLDGDFNQPGITIIPKTRVRPSGAISLTYDFTPVWGITGIYSYGNYGIKAKDKEGFLLYGHMHSLELLLSYDLVDAWFPRRKTNIFSLYFLGGLGLGFYNSELDLPDGIYTPRADGKYDEVGMISLGLQAEFNITREIGLGLKGMYLVYTNDVLDGKMQGTNNDCMEYASVYLRWKLEGRKKNHVRNLVDENDFINPLTEKAEPVKDTVVMYQKDTLVIINTETAQTATVPEQRYYVYFDNDRFDLTDQTLIKIQQFADVIAEDTTLCIELQGYCDNTGTEAHNDTLAQRRADRVRKELIDVYGIAEDRIVANGKGMLTNVTSSYAPNRRVSVRFISQEECDSLREEKEQVEEPAVESTEEPAVEETETVAEETVAETGVVAEETAEETETVVEETAAEEVLAVVTSERDVTTLSRLARDYYQNTYCWPYIYEANTDVLSSPDFIPEGIALRIPRLSAELTDPSNAEAMAQARQLAAKYQGK